MDGKDEEKTEKGEWILNTAEHQIGQLREKL
jgi:hypothetical protein